MHENTTPKNKICECSGHLKREVGSVYNRSKTHSYNFQQQSWAVTYQQLMSVLDRYRFNYQLLHSLPLYLLVSVINESVLP